MISPKRLLLLNESRYHSEIVVYYTHSDSSQNGRRFIFENPRWPTWQRDWVFNLISPKRLLLLNQSRYHSEIVVYYTYSDSPQNGRCFIFENPRWPTWQRDGIFNLISAKRLLLLNESRYHSEIVLYYTHSDSSQNGRRFIFENPRWPTWQRDWIFKLISPKWLLLLNQSRYHSEIVVYYTHSDSSQDSRRFIFENPRWPTWQRDGIFNLISAKRLLLLNESRYHSEIVVYYTHSDSSQNGRHFIFENPRWPTWQRDGIFNLISPKRLLLLNQSRYHSEIVVYYTYSDSPQNGRYFIFENPRWPMWQRDWIFNLISTNDVIKFIKWFFKENSILMLIKPRWPP